VVVTTVCVGSAAWYLLPEISTGEAVIVYKPAGPIIDVLPVAAVCVPNGSVMVMDAAIPFGRPVTTSESVAVSATVTLAAPFLLASWLEVAVTVDVPAPEGVNTPSVVIVPLVALQVTELL